MESRARFLAHFAKEIILRFSYLGLVPAAHVYHTGQLVSPTEPPLLLPLVPEAGMPEALRELATAATHVHHALTLVRRAAHGRLSMKTVYPVFLAAVHL